MAETRLSDLIEEEEQKLVFTFDPANDRVFYLEVTDIITGAKLDCAECTQSRGPAPKQLNDFDLDFSSIATEDKNIDLDLDDEEGFNDDEYDPDSYTIE